MPQQLIYTSAPRGLAAGRSGHCTVARSTSMREPLVLRLEQLSYYQHLSLSGGKERPIFTYRIIDIRGSRFHVLSRIQDAGLDFTGRTNFIAHHLALAPEEFRQFPTPPIILRDWPEWAKSWTREPTLLENEDWSALISLATKSSVPAQTWQRVTGDSVNGYGLLEARTGATFRVDDQTNETVLGLFAESIELLEVRDARRDIRAAALQYTFTTSMQEQDNPADFRWRCIHADNPAANRFAGPDCRNLSSVRANRSTDEEATFARAGRQAPRFVIEPQDVRITEGDTARFQAKAKGIPNPTYQWFSVDRTDNGQPLMGETTPELALTNPTLGKSRYVVRVNNSAGDAISRTATLSVEQKVRLAQTTFSRQASPPVSAHQRTKLEIDNQRLRLEEQARSRQKQNRKKLLATSVIILTTIAISYAILVLTGGEAVLKNAMARFKNDQTPEGQANSITNDQTTHREPLASAPIHPPITNPTNAGTNTLQDKPANSETMRAEMLSATGYDLPPGWTPQIIGGLSYSHAECHTNKQPIRFDLSVAGGEIRTDEDYFLFVYKTNVSKDFAFTATLSKIDPPSMSSLCGIMIRESMAANSSFLFIGASSQKLFCYLRETNNGPIVKPAEANRRDRHGPIVLKFNQENGQFVPACSIEDWPWQPPPNFVFPKKQQVFVGLAICSGSTNKTMAQFINVSDNGSAKAK